ncbi:MAG: LD-carboxypeptidase [Paludibacteraceae bacterium]|nr:LD-carboxypeptidase [Paludibacteraceae bacterium]
MRFLSTLFAVCGGLVLLSSCGDEITNEYVTNEYTNIYNKEYYATVLSNQKEITEDIRAPFLKKGDTVAVFALSNAVSQSDMAAGIATLKSWGLNVIEADNLYKVDGRYAGTLAERVDGTQKLINNPSVKAMIAARGGYGAAMTLPFLDLESLIDRPKWIVGYSDVTALHAAVNNLGVESIHGGMAQNLSNATTAESLRRALFGEAEGLKIVTNENCKEGVAEGRLVGGNLSLIYSLGGTAYDLNTKQAILFIEDTGESNYSLDRMLTQLKLSGKLDNIVGVVVGQFIKMSQGNDRSVEEIIASKFADQDIPIMYGVNVGHDQPNNAICLGRRVRLTVDASNASLNYVD